MPFTVSRSTRRSPVRRVALLRARRRQGRAGAAAASAAREGQGRQEAAAGASRPTRGTTCTSSKCRPTARCRARSSCKPGDYEVLIAVKEKSTTDIKHRRQGAADRQGRRASARAHRARLQRAELATSSVILANTVEPVTAPLTPAADRKRTRTRFGPMQDRPVARRQVPKAGELQRALLGLRRDGDAVGGKPDVTIDYNFHQQDGDGREVLQQDRAAGAQRADAAAGVQPGRRPSGSGQPGRFRWRASRPATTGSRSRSPTSRPVRRDAERELHRRRLYRRGRQVPCGRPRAARRPMTATSTHAGRRHCGRALPGGHRRAGPLFAQAARRAQPQLASRTHDQRRLIQCELHGIVRRSRAAAGGASSRRSAPTTAFAVSDRDGRFAFRNLPAGPYLVRAHLQGYVPARGRDRCRSAASAAHRCRPSSCASTPTAADAPPVLAAGVGPVDAPAAEPRLTATHDHGEVAWRLRHLKRSVLKDAERRGCRARRRRVPPSDSLMRLGRAVGESARLASALFSDLPLNGQINLLTTTSFDRPQDLFSLDVGAAARRRLRLAGGAERPAASGRCAAR